MPFLVKWNQIEESVGLRDLTGKCNQPQVCFTHSSPAHDSWGKEDKWSPISQEQAQSTLLPALRKTKIRHMAGENQNWLESYWNTSYPQIKTWSRERHRFVKGNTHPSQRKAQLKKPRWILHLCFESNGLIWYEHRISKWENYSNTIKGTNVKRSNLVRKAPAHYT